MIDYFTRPVPWRTHPLPPPDSFGGLLRQYRLERNISQTLLAGLVGVDPTSMSRVESGNRLPSLDRFGRIVDVLGLSDAELRRLLDAAAWASRTVRHA